MTKILDKMNPSMNGKHAPKKMQAAQEEAQWQAAFSNYAADIPLRIDQIRDSLWMLTDDWPKCISGVLCYVEDGEVRVLEDSSALFAWIAGHAPSSGSAERVR
jgi:hypothetical protein